MRSHIILRVFVMAGVIALLACGASGETMPYAGWTVGASWDGYGTILRSIDSGNTWTRQGAGQIANANMVGVFAVDPYTAWVVGGPDGGYGTIYHTTDGGSTWQRKGSAADVPDVHLAKVAAYSDSKVWAIGTGAIMHSSDGGATWTNQILPEYADFLLQGVHTPDGNTVWVTGHDYRDDSGVILKSTDAGLTWTRQSGGDATDAILILGISAVDVDTAWAVGAKEGGMGGAYLALHTANGGATWTDKNLPGVGHANEVCAVSASTVWVAADASIYWSTNGGQDWDSGSNHGLYGSLAFGGISAVSAQEAWGSYYGVHDQDAYVCHTTDGGQTWTVSEHVPVGLWGVSFATQPIPEPATFAMFVLSGFALALRHRWTR